ncbi:MAG: signal peptidase I [Solirubrobacteraceae bacterium]
MAGDRLTRAVRRPGSKLELVLIVACALFFAVVIQAFAVRPYVIPSRSMVPTLTVGQRIIVDRFSHTIGSDPKLGDVTVFHPPAGATRDGGQCGVDGEGPSYLGGPGTERSCSQATDSRDSQTYVKRVVGLPGDRIEIRDGGVIRNGRPAKEPFAASCSERDCNLAAIVVPPRSYFLMGDNRDESDDSRYWGPVPRGWIVGKVVATYWPPKRIGLD